MASCKFAIVLLCAVLAAQALPAKEEPRSDSNAIQTENDLIDGVYTDCLRKDSVSCLKYKLFSFVDKMLGHKDTITVTEDVKIIKTSSDKEGAPRSLNGNDSFANLLVSRVQRFLESYKIQVDIKGSDIVNAVSSTARSISDSYDSVVREAEEEENEIAVEEGRGKKKKKKDLKGPILAAILTKIAIVKKLAILGLAALAGKAFLVSKLALVLAVILWLKKLFHHHRQVTYEVVPHPVHTSSHVASHETVVAGGHSGGGVGYGGDVGYGGGYGSSGHGGGWERSVDAQKLAYKHQIPSLVKQ